VGYKRSPFGRFFNLLGLQMSLITPIVGRDGIGGSIHAYGFYWRLGCPEQYDLLEDTMEEQRTSCSLVARSRFHKGYLRRPGICDLRVWLKELGKKAVFIDPFCNYTAVRMADKWLAPRPGTDAAMAQAIAYVWLDEETYDKKFIEDVRSV